MRPVPLIFLTGFLGSGKTTLLNALLAQKGDLRVGVLVNEWGSISVDGVLLNARDADAVVEVNGGQIFCSCVSGSFVDGVARLAERAPDLIVVEASGLTRPGALEKVLERAVLRSGGKLRYGASVCVVDASRFGFISSMMGVAAREQAARADFLLLSKTDIATAAARAQAEEALRELRPEAAIGTMLRGALPEGFLASLLAHDAPSAPMAAPGVIVPGWGPDGKPPSALLTPSAPVGEEALRRFLEEVAPRVLRAKGIVEVAASSGQTSVVFAETAGPLVTMTASDGKPTPLVLIGGGGELEAFALQSWRRATGSDAAWSASDGH